MHFNESKIFSVNEENFGQVALEVFCYQYQYQSTYQRFCDGLKRNPDNVFSEQQIPFLPISFFKTENIIAEDFVAETVFESSGTTGSINSKHAVASLALYETSFQNAFKRFYGNAGEYCVLALLPSYLEKGNSSLVYMAERLMRQSNHPENGFFIHNFSELAARLAALEFQQQKVLLIGVTYALLDFAEQFPMHLRHTTIIETGGMKGRRKEMLREEVHQELKQSFNVENIHSEYGMTELLSQAYSYGNGIFRSPSWMKVLVRDIYNPQQILDSEKTGALNIIDLANIYSCAFIATDDIGIAHTDGSFEVAGRRDHADVRGCSLMYGVG
jgi:phenylacetate-coenzyme A ligase PaaK-like adenylate-forming protein